MSKHFKLFIYILLPITILTAFNLRYGIKINVSDSLPYKLFIIDRGDIQVKAGKMMAFIAPHNGYYKGSFGKIVVGMPGDEVKYVGREIYVNEKYIGKVKPRSKAGDKLKPTEPGIIPKGYYFMASDHKDSFDSRYERIGYVKDTNIIGTIHPIF